MQAWVEEEIKAFARYRRTCGMYLGMPKKGSLAKLREEGLRLKSTNKNVWIKNPKQPRGKRLEPETPKRFAKMERALQLLPEREYQVVHLRYFVPGGSVKVKAEQILDISRQYFYDLLNIAGDRIAASYRDIEKGENT